MSDKEYEDYGTRAAKEFADRVDQLTRYFRDEFDLTIVEAVGTLVTKAVFILIAFAEEQDDEEE